MAHQTKLIIRYHPRNQVFTVEAVAGADSVILATEPVHRDAVELAMRGSALYGHPVIDKSGQ